MMLRVLFVILICFTGCKKEKAEYNETYSKFYGKWRSINLEHPVEYDFGPKVIYYSGYLDRNGRLEISRIKESSPQFKHIALYLNYGHGQVVSIDYNSTLDTITCNGTYDYVFSGNLELKKLIMVRK